jgi:dephospho-CoA kinase
MGCGKSTALRYFRDLGAAVIETDAVVRSLLAEDRDLIREVREAFDDGVLDAEGKIDRRELGRRVFRNSDALARLEALIHPRVRDHWMRELKENHPVLIVEIPLLFEKDLADHFTLTICVSSRPEVQHRRLRAKGMTESQIQYRQQRQLSLEEKMRRADIILYNNGSPDHLREQVERVMQQLTGGPDQNSSSLNS